ncbi:uncharacterized protein LOC103715468 [Phoenix dactylifera]|uniref:Uncharacterized protein LOC103715468 n=1 Tax=Phoenix dactylifera TaxID=42345 RepID=A0A8B9A6M5_PHODC|nr:uncharacterized protein LOC103715468 [Phoenix dactylifera]XP_038979524.1 uncharacterized protein LOC103715468 [Phoenix dactylifera]XP_038979525.1 uncharacterized protein LOC103715468 [Phoenix dactylifera]XP_038979526.1 uncharacterized protein LOC103715468 [Phoenix dactylifera]XP_038979527.1 uncharacterized protein LOC103715468 [Phoenix dactylifera]XP_038979528.1 uncharacterized protein LOC103715468 [Phoenix dactylifera]XP_038979529.1 uncharacterized protein LOC103715468 [Phoenix dactylifer
MQLMEAELCSSRALSPSREESGDEELSVLPRHTKVIVTGNNRTKSVLVGLQGVVKKAVGLGGWHWLVLKNGVEVKLQRNALSVLEAPTGNEDDDDVDCDNSFCSSSDMGEKDIDYSSIECQKPTKPRVRHTRPWTSSAKSPWTSSAKSKQNNRGIYKDVRSHIYKPQTRVNLSKLGTATLWRYWRHFNLVSLNPNPSKEQLVNGVRHHFLSQQLDEMQVIVGFIHTAKRLKTIYS